MRLDHDRFEAEGGQGGHGLLDGTLDEANRHGARRRTGGDDQVDTGAPWEFGGDGDYLEDHARLDLVVVDLGDRAGRQFGGLEQAGGLRKAQPDKAGRHGDPGGAERDHEHDGAALFEFGAEGGLSGEHLALAGAVPTFVAGLGQPAGLHDRCCGVHLVVAHEERHPGGRLLAALPECGTTEDGADDHQAGHQHPRGASVRADDLLGPGFRRCLRLGDDRDLTRQRGGTDFSGTDKREGFGAQQPG